MITAVVGPALALVPSDEERSLRDTVYALTASFGPDYYGSYYDSCYQRRWIRTPYGYRWRTIRICDY